MMPVETSRAPPLAAMPGMRRSFAVGIGVVSLHVTLLWALHTGLLRRAIDIVVPVRWVSEVVEAPRPAVVPPMPAPRPTRQPLAKTAAQPLVPMPQLPVVANPEPASNAPTAVDIAPAPLPPMASPVALLATPTGSPPAAVAPAPPRIELPSSDADYLQNPKPAYPPASKRLGEQGTVLVHVLIGIDGLAHQADVQQSSGFNRLDQAALATVLKWRYVAGKRGGVPTAMWFTVPIAFVLK